VGEFESRLCSWGGSGRDSKEIEILITRPSPLGVASGIFVFFQKTKHAIQSGKKERGGEKKRIRVEGQGTHSAKEDKNGTTVIDAQKTKGGRRSK